MTAPVCETCGGALLELMRYRATTLGLEVGAPAMVRAFKCSGCGAISSSSGDDEGQGDLFEMGDDE